MVSFRSGRQGETWAEHTVAWFRKPRTQQERIGEWLGSTDLHELLTAMEALERQGPEASSLLRSMVHHDARKCREGKKLLRRGGALVGLTALAILCGNIVSPGIIGNAVCCLLLAIWLASPCALSWYEDYRTHGRRLGHAVALLHRLPLPGATAEMIEALDAGDSRTAALAAQSLIQLLPQLTEAEGALLQAKHRVALRHALRGYNSDLILAILLSSDKILDHTAIPDVKWLTQCPDWIAGSEKIQSAAISSLAALKAEVRRQRTGQTLLRSSSAPAASGDELLRPQAGVPARAAHQMLRASGAPVSDVTEEKRDCLTTGLSSLAAPPCPADAVRYPFYP